MVCKEPRGQTTGALEQCDDTIFSILRTTLSLLFISNPSLQAETLALCKNLNRNNTTPITVDLTASTVSWGGIFAAHITPASIDWTDSTHQVT